MQCLSFDQFQINSFGFSLPREPRATRLHDSHLLRYLQFDQDTHKACNSQEKCAPPHEVWLDDVSCRTRNALPLLRSFFSGFQATSEKTFTYCKGIPLSLRVSPHQVVAGTRSNANCSELAPSGQNPIRTFAISFCQPDQYSECGG
jgi:hypothetical protein